MVSHGSGSAGGEGPVQAPTAPSPTASPPLSPHTRRAVENAAVRMCRALEDAISGGSAISDESLFANALTNELADLLSALDEIDVRPLAAITLATRLIEGGASVALLHEISLQARHLATCAGGVPLADRPDEFIPQIERDAASRSDSMSMSALLLARLVQLRVKRTGCSQEAAERAILTFTPPAGPIKSPQLSRRNRDEAPAAQAGYASQTSSFQRARRTFEATNALWDTLRHRREHRRSGIDGLFAGPAPSESAGAEQAGLDGGSSCSSGSPRVQRRAASSDALLGNVPSLVRTPKEPSSAPTSASSLASVGAEKR